MTLTPDGDRHDPQLCGARKRQGEGTCAQAAGWGTSHPGTGPCKLHGGSTGSQSARASRIRAEGDARAVLARLGAEPIEDPLAALLKLAGQVVSWQEATASLVNGLEELRYEDSKGGEQLRSEVQLYERAMDRAASVLSAIARLNIEERLARVSEQQAAAVVAAIEAALAAAGVEGDRVIEARRAVARHLRSV